MKTFILLLIIGIYIILVSKKLRSKIGNFLKSISLKSIHGRIECSCDRHVWEQEKKAPGTMSYTDRISQRKSEEKAVCIIEKCSREGCEARRGVVDTGSQKHHYSADYLEQTIFASIEKQQKKEEKEKSE